MKEADKIYVDASLPATLRYGSESIHCSTIGEARLAWDRLSADDRARATIRASDGTVYDASQIDRLYVGPGPNGFTILPAA